MERGGVVGVRDAELVREGDYWTVVFAGHELRVRDSKGMRYLAELLSRPGVELTALELAGGMSAERISGAEARQEGLLADDSADPGPILDAEAKAAYKKRLEELRSEREEAEAFRDPERAARARAEYEAIADELADAVGLGGRDRRAGTASERARLNVTRAIKTSIERLGAHDADLGQFLSETVLTGRACVYRPDRAAPVDWRVVTRAPRGTTRHRFEPPETRYAQADGLNIAYQVLGDGPIDLVFVTGWLSHLDFQWSDPTFTRLLRNLAGFSRLIMFDRRGAGLSDPVSQAPTLEERADDIRAVLDAVGSERAVLFGLFESGAIMSFFAAAHPERTHGLVLYGPFVAGPWAGHPGTAELDEVGTRLRAAISDWGRGKTLAVLAPELAGNRVMRRLWGTFERASMSPAVAHSELDWSYQFNATAALPAICVPTLVLHCTGDVVPIETGRYVAEQIPEARFTPLAGSWHAPLTGDMDLITEAVEEFVTTLPAEPIVERVLAAVLTLDGDDDAPAELGTVGAVIGRAGGVLIQAPPGGTRARFDGPARAVRCALEILSDARGRGVDLRAGVDAGACELGEAGLSGAPLSISAELAGRAMPGELLATETVRDLAAGSGIEFTRRDLEIAGTPVYAALGIAVPPAVADRWSDARSPLLDRAALTMARRAPAMSRATLRLVKGDK